MSESKKIEELMRLPFVVRAYQKIMPHYSTCGLCGLPWGVVKHHDVSLNEHEGCFAVCEYCWERTTLLQVLEAHTEAYVDVITLLNPADRENRINDRPIEHVLDCVQKEYIKTRG